MAALKYEPPTIPLVLIVGGSATRECVTEDDALAALVGRLSDTRVEVVSAASTMQRLPSTLAILDNLPRGSGVVVIGINHATFVSSQADAETQLSGTPLLLASPALRDVTAATYGQAPAADIGPGLERHVDAYESKRGVVAFTGRELTYRRHRYDAYGASTLGAKRIMATRFAQGDGAPDGLFFTEFDFSIALLQRCVAMARGKGYEVLLMQDPLDEAAAGDAYAPYVTRYLPEVERIADANQALYVDLNKSVTLTDGDFLDLFHLLGSGREKWMAELGASLAGIVRDRVATTAAPSSQASPTTSADPPGLSTGPEIHDDSDWQLWQKVLMPLIACGLLLAAVLFLTFRRRRATGRERARADERAAAESTRRH